jgi:hypothetical protein
MGAGNGKPTLGDSPYGDKYAAKAAALREKQNKIYKQLAAVGGSANFDLQREYIEKLEDLGEDQKKYVEELNQVYNTLQKSNTGGAQQLKTQMNLLKNSEQQLQNNKDEMNKARHHNINNLRLTEINTYYSQQYKAYFNIFRNMVFLCIGLVFITMLRQRYILTSKIANILAIILIIIGLFFIIPPLLDIQARDNLVFEEYEFPFNAKHAKTGDMDADKLAETWESDVGEGIIHLGKDLESEAIKYEKDLGKLAGGMCIGKECCGPNQLFEKNKCKDRVAKSSNAGGSEGFLSGQSSQQPGTFINRGAPYNNPSNFGLIVPPNSNLYSLN